MSDDTMMPAGDVPATDAPAEEAMPVAAPAEGDAAPMEGEAPAM